MKRWHLTVGLTGLALSAALIAPRLRAIFVPPVVNTPDVTHPVAQPPVVDVPVPEEIQGRLILTAGLDHTAVLTGTQTERFLTITVKAPPPTGASTRLPTNVAVVMDASGSMSARGKIAYAKDAAKAVARAASPTTDDFALVTFADAARVVVPANRPDDQVFRRIENVYEGGGTNLYAGMELAQRELDRVLESGEVGRMIILSDGNANVGVTDPDMLAGFAARAAARGISVSALGLGVDYNEDLLARIADVGGGTYDFIDNPGELESVFKAEFEQMTTVVARNTSVTITLPPNIQPVDVIGWEPTLEANGWTVYLGDVVAGAERKIVTRVRVKADQSAGHQLAATVDATYFDLIDERMSESHTKAFVAHTADPNQVAASLDPIHAADANRAWGGRFLEMSTKAYARGEKAKADKLLDEGAMLLRSAASSTHDEDLADDAAELETQRDLYRSHQPDSEQGRRAIKMNKESVRARSR